MRYFRRGAHRTGHFTVAELQAQIAAEVIPTGQKVGGAEIVWKNGAKFYRWSTSFYIPDFDRDPDSPVVFMAAPEGVTELPALVGP